MLRVADLSVAYGPTRVLDGASLVVRPGEFASLVGPSGSGKSTLLRAVAGLTPHSAGRVELDLAPERVAFLFQDDALLPWRTARQNVALGLRAHGRSKHEALATADGWLERLGLAGLEHRFPARLSGGQRKRVALAQVLALEPRLLLMDEPFASLDAIVRAGVTEDLLRWVEIEGLTVVLVTHDLEEALALSDTVHLLSGGPGARVRRSYPVPFARPRRPLVARTDPRFGPLLAELWRDLAREVDPAREARTNEGARERVAA